MRGNVALPFLHLVPCFRLNSEVRKRGKGAATQIIILSCSIRVTLQLPIALHPLPSMQLTQSSPIMDTPKPHLLICVTPFTGHFQPVYELAKCLFALGFDSKYNLKSLIVLVSIESCNHVDSNCNI